MRSIVEKLPTGARDIYESVKALPIVSPHGHCDPKWWADDLAFPDPATLLIVPDHYVFRMLYSQGVALEDLGIGVPDEARDPRKIFRLFAQHWHCFLGTPSRAWMEHTLSQTLGVTEVLSPDNADRVYDQIEDRLRDDAFRPRALFDRFNIETLATTDGALDSLDDHGAIARSGWHGHIIPTFRPDSVLNPGRADHANALVQLSALTNMDVGDYRSFLDALRDRRAFFKACGATATDHDVPQLTTEVLPRTEVEALHHKAVSGAISATESVRYYGHMLTEMAQMSLEDGLVMQIHAGSVRSTNRDVFARFGPDKGADIPKAVDWVGGLDGLLNMTGNAAGFRLLVFTLDESTYARELAPMAGHWPCLRLGPPWWFHDSLNGIHRYFDSVVETAGYYNLAGFNDDTRAFLSIPARHDMWRIAVAEHLNAQVETGRLTASDTERLARYLSYESAKAAYRLDVDDS